MAKSPDSEKTSEKTKEVNMLDMFLGTNKPKPHQYNGGLQVIALEILYPGECHHMAVLVQNDHVNFWLDMETGKSTVESIRSCFSKYSATLDNPAAMHWEKFLEAYPDAKVLLSIRDSDGWYKSVSKTIFNFQLDLSRENVKLVFDKWNNSVIEKCPKDKLLVFNVKEGWEPLCDFLDLPVPDVPFPNANDTASFKKLVLLLNTMGYVILASGVALVAVVVQQIFMRSKSLK